MYELKRAEHKTLDVKLGDDIIHADLSGGLKRYRNYVTASHKLEVVTAKIQGLKDATEIPEEFYGIYRECVVSLIRNAFSNEDTEKIMAFFEDNADEALEQLLPFLQGEYLEALQAERNAESRRKLETI